MFLRVFSILDIKSDSYSVPFFKPTVGVALREFESLVRDSNSWPGKYPSDFKLVEIGMFDDSNGKLISHDSPVSLGFGSDFVERKLEAVPRKVS